MILQIAVVPKGLQPGGYSMPVYNKLVRDKIPAVISAGGKECRTSTIGGDAVMKALRQKLL